MTQNPGAEDRETEEPLAREELVAEEALLAKAVGGWRGMIDSALPSVVFIVLYVVMGLNDAWSAERLRYSLIAAVAAGVIIAVIRLLRRESLQQVVAGFVGVAVSAFVAARTGNAEDYFLPGILLNVAYFLAFVISVLIRWPLIGVIVGLLTTQNTAWRHDAELRRIYSASTWLWAGLFGVRLIVQVLLYLAGWVAPLGVLKILMGWPLYLAAVYFTYRLISPALKARRSVTDERL